MDAVIPMQKSLKDDLFANFKCKPDTLVLFREKIYHIKRIFNGRLEDKPAYMS